MHVPERVRRIVLEERKPVRRGFFLRLRFLRLFLLVPVPAPLVVLIEGLALLHGSLGMGRLLGDDRQRSHPDSGRLRDRVRFLAGGHGSNPLLGAYRRRKKKKKQTTR